MSIAALIERIPYDDVRPTIRDEVCDMRSVVAIAFAALALTSCDHAPTGAAPGITGPWTALLPGFPANGTAVYLTLRDASGAVSGTASWGAPYSVTGSRVDSTVSFSASSPSTGAEGWTFSGSVAGSTMTGTIVKGAASISAAFGKGAIVPP